MKLIMLLFLLTAGIRITAQQPLKSTVHFDYDESIITAGTAATLDSLISSNQPSNSIQAIDLSGHCDPRGSDQYNDKLSERRVNAVRDYLVSKGIHAGKISSVSAMGERVPLNTNSNEEEMAANRRVEITLLKENEAKAIQEKPNEKTLEQQITDTAARTGTTLVLKNLNFEGGRHVLLPSALPVLQELLNVLKANPTLEISIEGHVCCAQGTIDGYDIDTKTYDLSVNRAKMVHDYLVSNGIDGSRLSWDGYGNRYPIIATEITEEDRTTNRRVEIKILKR